MNNQLSEKRGRGAGISKILLVATIVAVLIAALLSVVLIRFLNEPRYQGRRIAYWIRQLGEASYQPSPEVHFVPFHHIGTNSLPYLGKAIEARDPFYGKLLMKLQKHLPPQVSARLLRRQWNPMASRRYAMGMIGMFGPEAAPTVPALTNALQGPDSALVCDILGKIGPKASNAIPVLVHLATSGHPMKRADALLALSRIDVEGVYVEPLLNDVLNDRATVWRTTVLDCFIDRDRISSSLTPALLKSLESSRDRFEQAGLLRVMAISNGPFESVKEQLLQYAESPDAILCVEALRALGRLGPRDSATRQILLSNLKHDVIRVRGQAAQTLARASETPVPEVLALLNDPAPAVQIHALEAAWHWRNRPSNEIARHLAELLSEGDSTTMFAETDGAVFALIKDMGPEAAPVVPRLSNILQETNQNHYFRRLEAVKALGSIGSAPFAAEAKIREWSQSEVPTEALVAMTALWQITRKREPPVTSILTTIRQSPWLRSTGVEMLERLGPVAQPAIPVLEDYAADKNYPDAAKAAKAALARIRGSDPSGRAAADQKSSAE